MSLIKSPSDGDCFYHSVINGLEYYDKNFHKTPKEIKLKVAKYIQDDESLYQDLLIEWKDFNVIDKNTKMSMESMLHIIINTNEWAVSTIIHIVSLIFQIQIVVHEEINSKVYSESFPSFWKEYEKYVPKYRIHILKKGNHYDLIIPKESVKESVKVQQLGDNSVTTGLSLSFTLIITFILLL